MTDLLQRDPSRPEPAARVTPGGRGGPAADDGGRRAGEQARRALLLVDRTLHLASLLGRAASYLLLAWLATRATIGPHLVAGVLYGDFAAFAALAARTWRRAPRATLAEGLLFTALFGWWWLGYSWPPLTEHRALFGLAAAGALVGRLTARHRDLFGHTAPGWE